VASVLERRGVYKDLVGIPEGKKLPETHKSGWEYNIELDFQEIKWGHVLDSSVPEEGQVEVCKRVITEL
jgi:hypothetical protein